MGCSIGSCSTAPGSGENMEQSAEIMYALYAVATPFDILAFCSFEHSPPEEPLPITLKTQRVRKKSVQSVQIRRNFMKAEGLTLYALFKKGRTSAKPWRLCWVSAPFLPDHFLRSALEAGKCTCKPIIGAADEPINGAFK